MSQFYKGPDFMPGKRDSDEAKDGLGPIVWNHNSPGKFPVPTEVTMPASKRHFCKEYADRPGPGYRKLIKREMVATNPKKPDVLYEKLTLAPEYTYLTYREFGERIDNIAKGLMELHDFALREHIVIYAETQMDWMATAQAAWGLNLQVVTVYATLGPEGAAYAVNQTKAAVIVVDGKLGKNMPKLRELCPSLQKVIVLGEGEVPGDNVINIEEVISNGAKSTADVEREPEPTDIAVVMYTSGTTGNPKGVLISHQNMRTVVVGCDLHFDALTSEDRIIAYLPLAHIFELIVECYCFAMGMTIGYGSPHTLTNTGVKLATGCLGDMTLFKPTIAVFAPAVIDKIYAAIKLRISMLGGIAQTLFRWAIMNGEEKQSENKIGANILYQTIVLKKIQALVGGELRLILSGSAPLSAEIQRFVQTCMNAPVRQGYGLTETCAASVIQDTGDNTVCNVGAPQAAAVIRLRDWPEGGYLWADKDKEGVMLPRGEVLIGGPCVTQGYLVDEDGDPEEAEKMRQKNEEEYLTIDGVRYFATGDIAVLNNNNTLQIVDRKKDLFKGANGEYVALSKVESLLKTSNYVDMPMVVGRTGEANVVCLISPDFKWLENLARSLEIPEGTSMVEICKNKDVRAAVTKDCLAKCKEGGLLRFETPTAFAIVCDETGDLAWTPENGYLTAAMKMKRPIICQGFKDVITELYASS